MQALDQLKQRMTEIGALNSAAGVLGWDQQTYMPTGGAEGRADQLSVLSKISHEMSTSGETARLLEESERAASDLDPESDDAAYLRVARRDFDQSVKLPTQLVAEMTRTSALAHEHWVVARQESDYARFAPWLEKTLDLTRQAAEHLGYKDEIYDALLNLYEPEMKAADVRHMFDVIKPASVALIREIVAKGPDAVDSSVLTRDYDEAKQLQFGEIVVKKLGFDFTRGRQDRAVHPFCASFRSGDVRLTTRTERNFLPAALFGSIHETGHGLYEQGISPRYDGNVLGGGVSLGVHESQSRLWENLVGRSREFWRYFYPDLRKVFPESLAETDSEAFYRAINKVSPSLIRVEADELTYNLHILLRFEMECDLLSGKLSVADAPAAWNARTEEYLGLTPPNDAQGILQDVHWSGGSIGYFPTYSVGNILAVQLFEKADRDLGGSLRGELAAGRFSPLLDWLRENVHQWGRKYDPMVLIERITGERLNPEPYLRYLKTKYGDIYALDQSALP